MQLQATTSIALWLLSYLTSHRGVTSGPEIAYALGVKRQRLTEPVGRLKEYGYIQTVPGTFGGYALKKAPEDITVQEILELFHDDLHMNQVRMREADYDAAISGMKRLIEKAEHDFEATMSACTLADLMR